MGEQVDDTVMLELTRALASATRDGQLSWHTTPSEDAYRALFHGGLVRVEFSLAETYHPLTGPQPAIATGSGEPCFSTPTGYQLVIMDEKSREVARFAPAPGTAAATEVARLWESARQSAFGAGRVVQSILAELSGRLQKKP